MKKLALVLLSSVAIVSAAKAADVAEEIPAASMYDWSGVYVGLIGGVTAGDSDYAVGATGIPGTLNVSTNASGGFIGGQLGYDWQMGNFVIGGVADIAWANNEANVSLTAPGLAASVSSELSYLGTLRARLGYATDRVLFYAHGGWAYGKTKQSASATAVGIGAGTLGGSTSKNGWTIGAGIEYAAFDNISFGTEYGYFDLGTDTVFSGAVPALGLAGATATESVKFHQLKFAVNYRF